MRIVIVTVRVPFVRGGAELLASELERSLIAKGHQVETFGIPFKWYPPERILDHLLACRLLDITESCGAQVDLMIGLKFPAFHIPHPHKNLWIVHQHRQAYDLWDHPEAGDLMDNPNGAQIRDAVRAADDQFLPEANGIYTISNVVSKRLRRYNGIESEPLYHPPPSAEELFTAVPESYLFYPSRLSKMKRQALVIEALARTREPVRVRFAGTPDYPPYGCELKELAEALRVSDRIEWLGQIDDREKFNQYARSTGVIFSPVDEDYGYVTLESMLSSKPVITCKDSGEPKEFVVNGETGYVVEPLAAALAAAMDNLWSDRDQARRMGIAARDRYHDLRISWDTVTDALTR